MKILVGSRALKWWFVDSREPKDTDYFSDAPIEGAETFWHPNLAGYEWLDKQAATPIELYTIKVSHAFWDLHGTWNKHMHDIAFIQSKGYGYIVPELYDILYPIWEERYGKKKVNLNASPEDFFNKNVVRVFDHDSIHRSIAYHDRPLYESILRDGHAVMVDKAKFDALSYEDKLRLVREEVYATALERQVIPSGYTCSPRGAYAWALKKTITSFSKGWFPLFIVDNYNELKSPDVDYVKRHKDNEDRLIRL
ncbi:hypothetical protein HWB76_gp088 [Streptomyces phage Blueeyedbeauty]|uniref:Uncharacterized protein n=1 Tax=Streptomyces phage Blueeyedbeauty TaxID=2250336 RepID=A0A345L211_9CAUD|nr:hypothetical protein HWB76_gp088 [Streptomyces phage Blueeyedbeauty]AXH49313.1 hypothetical protein SEA_BLUEEYEDBEAUTY_205 [Streptomyces phage Blueeyedbeauty]